jgi:hypothetical protein
MFKRDEIPQREQDLQASVTRALDQMIFHQRLAEGLQDFFFVPIAGPLLRRQADHHFKMALYWRKRAGEIWRAWQCRLKQREAFLEAFQVAPDA